MKRISVIAFITLLLLAVSCDGSAPAPDTESGRLLLETNVRSIQKDSSTAAESRIVYETGEPIIGVLLQTNTGSKDTFRLEYLGDGKVKENGDGMEYNYILYQPEAIPDAYMEAGGNEIVATKTGSPFWWYMRTYLKLSTEEVYSNWYAALTALLDNQEALPYPKAEDCTNPKVTAPVSYDEIPEDFIIPEIREDELIFISNYEGSFPHLPSLINVSQTKSPFARAENNEDYAAIISNAFYLSENLNLYVPTILDERFGGDSDPGTDGLWTYARKFLGVSIDQVREEGSEILLNALRQHAGEDGRLPLEL